MKTTLLITLFSLTLGLSTTTHASEPYFGVRSLGDVNGDTQVTIQDASVLQQFLSGNAPFPRCFAACDANVNGKLESGDVALIVAWATGTEVHPGLSDEGVAACSPAREELEALALEPIPVVAKVRENLDGDQVLTIDVDCEVFSGPGSIDVRVDAVRPNGRMVRFSVVVDSKDFVGPLDFYVTTASKGSVEYLIVTEVATSNISAGSVECAEVRGTNITLGSVVGRGCVVARRIALGSVVG